MQKYRLNFLKNTDDISFLLRILVWAGFISVGTILVSQENVAFQILGIILNGLMFVHGIELQHQAIHFSGFSSRALNILVGQFLGLPMLTPFHHYQLDHLRHHKYIGTDNDIEFFDRSHLVAHQVSLWNLLKIIYSFNRIKKALHIFNERNPNYIKQEYSKSDRHIIQLEYIAIGVILAVVTILSIEISTLIVINAWLIPLILIAEPIHTLIELPEHFDCFKKSKKILENTRTIETSWLLTWFTNGNNFHVEHHLFPNTPLQRLSTVHQQIKSKILFRNKSYFECFESAIQLPSLRSKGRRNASIL